MGNIPAKITGKYQSYDINTPSHSTPPMPVRQNDHIEDHLTKEDCTPARNDDPFENNLQNEHQEEANLHQTGISTNDLVYNEQAVDTGENEDYVETHVSNHLENSPRQVDVMY